MRSGLEGPVEPAGVDDELAGRPAEPDGGSPKSQGQVESLRLSSV